ncbi:hypothetical protein OG921_04815 [Aldersonia sp. NBC_00410]|uniref:hypothetical protein n=1 Tax=Aldersonia sp. NBC_00410 TaxID=2975954 RepID=UPI00224CAF95|nr:hypothetical protein [Aldersonia sp. NBC_00410]MCX5042494.1 hypothetical protein [Aldersonia sp. NBC_00410]
MTEHHDVDHGGRELAQMAVKALNAAQSALDSYARLAERRVQQTDRAHRLAEEQHRNAERERETAAREVERRQRMQARELQMAESSQRMAERELRMADADLAAQWAAADLQRDTDPAAAATAADRLRERGVDIDEARVQAEREREQAERDGTSAPMTDTEAVAAAKAAEYVTAQIEEQQHAQTDPAQQAESAQAGTEQVEPELDAAYVRDLLDDADPWRSEVTDMTMWPTDFSEPTPEPALLADTNREQGVGL